MLLQKLLKILLEDHVAGSNDHVGLLHSLNDFDIVHKSSDIRIINCVYTAVLIEQACKEDYFKDHRGYLMCRLQYDDAEYDYVRLPFGTDTETYGTSLIGRLFGWSTAIDWE